MAEVLKSSTLRMGKAMICLHVLLAAALPFCLTRLVLETNILEILKNKSGSTSATSKRKVPKPAWNLPLPVLHPKKTPPDSTYTGGVFDDPHSDDENSRAIWSQHRVDVHMHIAEDHVANLNATLQQQQEEDETIADGFDGYQPAGQHLLLDIQNVDSSFLQDTERMAHAMVEITKLSSLTLLSYHCHDLQAPMGVSCVGVLLESHVSLHTWPSAGIISLDLFTCGPASLLPLVPVLEGLFAIPSSGENDPEPSMRWLYKKRGYRDYHDIVQQNLLKYAEPNETARKELEMKVNETKQSSIHEPQGVDLERYFLGWKGYDKGIVADQKTEYQEVAVFEMSRSPIPLSREKLTDESQVLKPNKKLFLDNVAQSSLLGLEAYHEALVGPALVAHPSPKRVAILGAGEGAALRECLKISTVESCTMIEIDAEFIQIARDYLQEWNDCSNLPYNAGKEGYVSCFDDPRAEVHTVDAVDWFISRFGDKNATSRSDKFDVIIMDAFDPLFLGSVADLMYTSEDFVDAIMNSLTDQGILVFQLALTRNGKDSTDLDPVYQVLEEFTSHLEAHGAKSMKAFGEGHAQFWCPWDFEAVFKGTDSESNWMSQPAQVDLRLAKRAFQTKNGSISFRYMDGATMATYQYHSSAQDRLTCDLHPDLALCTTQASGAYSSDKPPSDLLDEITILSLKSAMENAKQMSKIFVGLFGNVTADEAHEVMLPDSIDGENVGKPLVDHRKPVIPGELK